MTGKIKLITAMVTFGTLAVFVKYIPLDSSIIALTRGALATLFLLAVMAATKMPPDRTAIRRNLVLLIISGGMIGFNWILLFEAYNYTSVAVATLCYYLAPVFVIIASPFLLGEKMTMKKTLCVIAALMGMVLVSGVIQNYGSGGGGELSFTGVALGTAAGALYASIIIINKKLREISPYDTTVVQLASAAIVLLPYCLLTVDMGEQLVTPIGIFFLIIVGIVHTGIAYVLYFGSIKELPAQTVAVFSYIDPILAVLISAVFLKEKMDVLSAVGAILILGSTFVSEMKGRVND